MAIERTLVQIRERSMLDVLDLALVVLRRKGATLALATFVGIAPFALLNAWLFHALPEYAPGIALLAWLAEAPFATAPLTVALGGLMFGQAPRASRVVGSLLRSSLAMVVVHGLLRYLLFWWNATRMAFANEILLLERGKWWKVLGRGNDLSSDRGGELFLLGLFQVILTYVLATMFWVGASAINASFFGQELTWDMPGDAAYPGWLFQLPVWLITTFFAVARFLAYIDQRIRLEGWEVELRLREVGESMAEARRW